MKFNKAFVFSADADTALALCKGAAALADSCTAAVLGERQLADRLADGADKVFWLGERAEGAITESYCGALEELIRSEAAQLVLLGTGKRDRCIAAKLAVRLDAAVFTDASEVSLTEDGLCVKRRISGGAAEATVRSGSAVIYFKQSEHIEDLLTTLGAPVAATEIMTAKVDKEIRNGANRAMNCDMANVNKTLDAVAAQQEAIEKLEKAGQLERLPEKIQETARLRMQNPELPLAQLAALFDPPISKSCLNHRIRKIMEEARKLS